MGSKRKRDEKKKDFQKAKLKVGKTQAKPDNYTDTSFTAKSIALPNQTIARKADTSKPKEEVDLTHHLQLTKHHLAQTRKEVLNYIEHHLPTNTSLYKTILTSTISLITDTSAAVRDALVSLLSACADKQPGFLELHMRSIILFAHSAMTHIRPEVRASSTRVLDLLVTKAPKALVKGHFVKTLKSYFWLMAWNLSADKKSLSLAVNTAGSLGLGKKTTVQHLATLRRLLDAALNEREAADALAIDWSKCHVPHAQTPLFMIPTNPQAYAQLKLFIDEVPRSAELVQSDVAEGSFSIADIDALSTEDQETRRKITHDVFLGPLKRNLANNAKDEGELGREANACIALLNKFEADFNKASDDSFQA